MKSLYFIYVISGVLLVAGAWLLLRFFLKRGYQRITDYNFSAGLLIFVFGIVVLVRAGEMTEFFAGLMGILLAVEAAILFQMTIQIIGLHGKAWLLPAVSGVLVLGVSFVVMTGYKNIFRSNPTLFFVCLFIAGILGFVSLVTTGFRSHSFKKEEKAREESMRADVEADYVIADAQEKKPEPIPEVKTEALPEKEAEGEPKKPHKFFGGNRNTQTPPGTADHSSATAAAVKTDLFTDEEMQLLSDDDEKK